jgi:anaerobic ribonucleoside-triphosphate reductase activating protein
VNYHNITTDDMLNGDGLRVVLWVSGCSIHCFNCQNPQTHSFDSGIPFLNETMQEILDGLSQPYISGLTLSGGHPLEYQNINTVYGIVKTVKEKFPNKSIWLYTGYTWEEILDKDKEYEDHKVNGAFPLDVIKYCDVLVDGKYEDDKRDISLAWRGSSNQRVISVQESLNQDKVVLYCE